MAKERIIHAVHESDLIQFLESIGISDDMKCSVCGNAITVEQIARIVVHSSELKLFCDKDECGAFTESDEIAN